MEKIADILTMTRFVISGIILAISLLFRPDPCIVAALYFSAWLSDNLDGYLARKSRKGKGNMGKFDAVADILLIFSGLVFVHRYTGRYSGAFLAGYGIIWALSYYLTENDAVFMSFSFAALIMSFIPVWNSMRSIGIFAIVWGIGTAVVKRRALMDHIRRFLTSLKSLVHGGFRGR